MVRFKNRWLLLSLDFPSPPSSSPSSSSSPPPALTSHLLTSLLRKTLTSHFGLAATGALGGPLSVKYYSPKTHLAIVRCARVGEETIRGLCCLLPLSFPAASPSTSTSALASSGSEGGVVRGRCRVIAVSGTIKKLQQRVIRGDRRVIQLEGTKAKKRAKRGKTKQTLKNKEKVKGNEGQDRSEQERQEEL
ncbi:hypothetical protein BCV69DRAFT_285437, partial [Microstroma glucosiphilum]